MGNLVPRPVNGNGAGGQAGSACAELLDRGLRSGRNCGRG